MKDLFTDYVAEDPGLIAFYARPARSLLDKGPPLKGVAQQAVLMRIGGCFALDLLVTLVFGEMYSTLQQRCAKMYGVSTSPQPPFKGLSI